MPAASLIAAAWVTSPSWGCSPQANETVHAGEVDTTSADDPQPVVPDEPVPTWPQGLPHETVSTAACDEGRCLVVEPDSTYCSIDAFTMRDGLLFAPKSSLTIRPGVYPISGRDAIPELTITVQTEHGTAELHPEGHFPLIHKESVVGEDGTLDQIERIEIKSPYVGDDLRLEKFFLRTSSWPYDQFRLGDPEDLFWFYWVQRNLLLRISDTSPLFPGLVGETILYAPCEMRGQPDEVFTFAFEDGGALDLTVRAINGVRELGYYTGRLFSATGVVRGRPVHVDAPTDLAFFGSTRSWAETAIPSLAVRTGDTDRGCGYMLDAAQWDTPDAVDGYVAYVMNCDETRGEQLPLRSVRHPDRYSLP